MAANPRLDRATLAALAGDADPEVRVEVARNPGADAALLAGVADAALAAWDGAAAMAFVLEAVVRRPTAGGATVAAVAAAALARPEPLAAQIVGRALAFSPNADAGLRGRLAAHPDPSVRHGAASALETPPALLARLAEDARWGVRAAAGANPSTPVEALTALATDPSEQVLFGVGQNPSTPEPALLSLAAGWSMLGFSGLTRNPSLRGELADLVRTHWYVLSTYTFAFDGDPELARERERAFDSAYDVVARGDRMHPAYPPALAEVEVARDEAPPPSTLASHPLLGAALLARLARLASEDYAYMRRAVASHLDAPPEVVLALVDDREPMVRQGALGRAPLSIALGRLDDEAWEARAALAARPDVPPEPFARLAGDRHEYVRRAAGRNPAAPAAALEALASDAHVEVRKAVAANPALPEALRRRLADDAAPDVARRAAWYLRAAAFAARGAR